MGDTDSDRKCEISANIGSFSARHRNSSRSASSAVLQMELSEAICRFQMCVCVSLSLSLSLSRQDSLPRILERGRHAQGPMTATVNLGRQMAMTWSGEDSSE